MNPKQNIVMWLGILTIIAAVIVPPWRGVNKNLKTGLVITSDYIGYSLITSPPKVTHTVAAFFGKSERVEKDKYRFYSIDWMRLSITIFVILLVALGLLITFKDTRKSLCGAEVNTTEKMNSE